MSEPAATPAPRPSPSGAPGRARAFTLLELLMVMTLIAILATITMVLGRGIGERSKIAQARAELAVLAAALEQYKQQYGDYPWTPEPVPFAIPATPDVREDSETAVLLFNALCGNVGPKGTQLTEKGRTLVDLSRFKLWLPEIQLPDPELPNIVNNWFADPWGKWYYYHYKKGADDTTWVSKGFLLYSHGPDTKCFIGNAANTGLLDSLPDDEVSKADNADNIYHGRN